MSTTPIQDTHPRRLTRAYLTFAKEGGQVVGRVVDKRCHEGTDRSGYVFAVRAASVERVRELVGQIAPERGFVIVNTSKEL